MTERVFWSAAEGRPDWLDAQDRLAVQAILYGSEHSPEIGARLETAGIEPASVCRVADLERIPTLSKDDLPELQAAAPPFAGMLAVPVAELRRIYRSPGGICDPEGQDEDYWRMAPALWAAGFRPGQTVLNTLSYHLTPGGHMLDAGLRAVGCVVAPGGVGNSAEQIELAGRAGVSGYVGTPQFLLTLVEKASAANGAHPFRRALVTGGPLLPTVRAALESEHGVDVFEAYGTADAGGLGYECKAKRGWHVSTHAIIEILSPATGDPVPAGRAGEVVVTNANSVYPLLRFATGDLSALDFEPCECGRTTPRLVGFLGRVGEGVKVRGMFVYPRQLASVLDQDPTVGRYQGVVTSDERDDVLTVSVEPGGDLAPDAADLTKTLRDATKVRLTVEVVPAGTMAEDVRPLIDARQAGARSPRPAPRLPGGC